VSNLSFGVVLGFLLIGYFAPTIFAIGKKNAAAIFALNLMTGWTFIGWVGALVWALATPKK
jgi:hypothetical protein